MAQFEILVDLNRLERGMKWNPGIKLGVNDDRGFIEFLVQDFIRRFRRAIQDQRFNRRPMKSRYVPLSEAWLDRKKKLGLEPGFWQATGQIEDGIRGVRIGNSRKYRIGWDKRKAYRKPRKGGGLGESAGIKVWKLVRILEFGPMNTTDGRLQTGRPLIRPIMIAMQKQVRDLYLAYLKTILEFDRRGRPLPRRGTGGKFLTDSTIDRSRKTLFDRLFGLRFRSKDRIS